MEPTTVEEFTNDAGYSGSKGLYMAPDGFKTVQIPSAIALPLQLQQKNIEGGQRIYNYNGNELVVGDDALLPGSIQIHNRNEEWLLKYMALLLYGTAEKAGVDLRRVSRVTLGLPIESYSQETRTALAKNIRAARIDGSPIIRDDCQIRIHCQGVGALAAFKAENNPYDEMNGLVLDVGGNTLMSVSFYNLNPSASGSNQYDKLGMMSAAEHLSPFLSEMAGTRVSSIKAANAMRTGKFKGEDISMERDKAIAKHGELLISTLKDAYSDTIGELDTLVLAGGGAGAIYNILPAEWKKKAVVLSDPEFANVRGYYALSQGMQ